MIPIAFRVKDFKSIRDSGRCDLSADNISVLAGQNESGKTAVLTALRDFDLPIDDPPKTKDFRPEDRFDAKPEVTVWFELEHGDVERLAMDLKEEFGEVLPTAIFNTLRGLPELQVTRDLAKGTFAVNNQLREAWDMERSLTNATPAISGDTANGDPVESKEEETGPDKAKETSTLEFNDFIDALQARWPTFVYFDSFEDTLPREVEFASLVAKKSTQTAGSTSAKQVKKNAPQTVLDLITLANLDVAKIEEYSNENKVLGNYLSSCAANITGDFLTYWKQKVDAKETVTLHIRHSRDESGELHLEFYVHDNVDQYPEQRSKGFLWFLSFYLRLAAERHRNPERKRLLLIDEPGSYLHARAQKDVLHLFEDRLSTKDQIIYSTHSPFLLPANKLHRLRVVFKSTEHGTRVFDRLTHPELRGESFQDTLSPVLTAIGLDIREALSFVKEQNLVVEGISDHFYLATWASKFRPKFLEKFNIFPGMGATSVPVLCSLFIGWGLKFVVLLDRDDQGNATREKLTRELGIRAAQVIQPKNAAGIEDLFSIEDFRAILKYLDSSITLPPHETPVSAIRRHSIDKVLLARAYAENATAISLTKKTTDGIALLFDGIEGALS